MLPAGPIPADAAELLDSRAMTELLRELRGRADVVLVDVPPMLPVTDAMVLGTKVDAVVAVARARLASRPQLVAFGRALEACAAPRLGFVFVGGVPDEAQEYGGYVGVYARSGRRRPAARTVAGDRTAVRVVLVCSSGGHLIQLHQLKPWWSKHERRWVTFDLPDSRSLLQDEDVTWAYHPTTRNFRNALRNLLLAVRMLPRLRPDVVVSDGAAVAFPFFIVARLLRIPTVYLEVYDRIDSPTLTGRLCRPLSSLFLVQWEEQCRFYPGARVIGGLF